jgi:hypothetical protein
MLLLPITIKTSNKFLNLTLEVLNYNFWPDGKPSSAPAICQYLYDLLQNDLVVITGKWLMLHLSLS